LKETSCKPLGIFSSVTDEDLIHTPPLRIDARRGVTGRPVIAPALEFGKARESIFG